MPKAMTYEEIEKMVEKENYVLHKLFTKNKKTWINITCPNNHNYDKRLDGFKSGERCAKCRKLSYEEIKTRVKNRGYKLLSENYDSVIGKILIECPRGHIIEMQLNNFTSGKGCKVCANNVKHSYDYIRKQIEKEDGYKLLSTDYINGYEKLLIQCNKGHIYEAPYNSFRSGHRCPHCPQISLGENKIKEVLESKNIDFISQHHLKDCIYKSKLYFDFYLRQYNTCIEYDGRQHFEPVKWGNMTQEEANNEFKEVQIRDEIKNKYCQLNGIKLIIIPYWEFNNIESILSNNLT